MLLIVPHVTSPGMFDVTFVHVAPPSRVTCTSPSFVPAQMSPFSRGDSAMANTTPAYSTPMLSGVSPPEMVVRRDRERRRPDEPVLQAVRRPSDGGLWPDVDALDDARPHVVARDDAADA